MIRQHNNLYRFDIVCVLPVDDRAKEEEEEGENGDEAVEKFASGAQEGKICSTY